MLTDYPCGHDIVISSKVNIWESLKLAFTVKNNLESETLMIMPSVVSRRRILWPNDHEFICKCMNPRRFMFNMSHSNIYREAIFEKFNHLVALEVFRIFPGCVAGQNFLMLFLCDSDLFFQLFASMETTCEFSTEDGLE